jgi:hypothetical protein
LPGFDLEHKKYGLAVPTGIMGGKLDIICSNLFGSAPHHGDHIEMVYLEKILDTMVLNYLTCLPRDGYCGRRMAEMVGS